MHHVNHTLCLAWTGHVLADLVGHLARVGAQSNSSRRICAHAEQLAMRYSWLQWCTESSAFKVSSQLLCVARNTLDATSSSDIPRLQAWANMEAMEAAVSGDDAASSDYTPP
jgi:hypothetical protein